MNPVTYGVLTAIFWSGMAIVAKYSGVPSYAASGLIALGTLTAVPLSLAFMPVGVPLTGSIYLCLLAGVINGFGIFTFGSAIMGGDASKMVPLIYGMTIAVAAMGGFLFLGEVVTLSKIVGILMVVGGMYFLSG